MRDAPDPVAALLAARLSGRALPAFPAPVPATLAEAYDVQRRLTAALGAPVPGWKIGRVPPARSSDEHTPEVQSLMRTSYAVFCLQKKKSSQVTTQFKNTP